MKASGPVICLMVFLGLLCLWGVGMPTTIGLLYVFGEKEVLRYVTAGDKVTAEELLSLERAGCNLPQVVDVVSSKLLRKGDIGGLAPDSEVQITTYGTITAKEAKELKSLARWIYPTQVVDLSSGKVLREDEIERLSPYSKILIFQTEGNIRYRALFSSKDPLVHTFEIYRRVRPTLRPSLLVFMLTSLLVGLGAGRGIYWLTQLEETIEMDLLTKKPGPQDIGPIVTLSHIASLLTVKTEPQRVSRLSRRDWRACFRLPRLSALRSRVDVTPVLWHRGTGMIVMGVVHLIVPGLAWQAAIPLILIGVLNIVLPIRGMFILNGLLLLGIGILNALSGWDVGSVFWKYFGIIQGGWGLEEIGAFHVNRPTFSRSALDDHLASLSDPKARAEFLLGVFSQRRQFDIRRGVLNRLADMGEQAACAAPTLKLFLSASSVPLAVKVWIHCTISQVEGSVDDHSRAIATILKEHAYFGEGCADDNAPQKAATDALVSMGEHGHRALLSIASDPKCRAEARAVAIETLGTQIGNIKDLALRADIISAWVDAMDDNRVHGCVYIRARHSLTNIAESDLGKHKDEWSQWWQTNKAVIIRKWELKDNP